MLKEFSYRIEVERGAKVMWEGEDTGDDGRGRQWKKDGGSATFASNIGHIGIFYTVYAHIPTQEDIGLPRGCRRVLRAMYNWF